MRKPLYALTALLLFAQFSCGPTHVVVESPAPPPPPPPAPEVSYQNFYDALSPYGEWVNNPEYGYVWMPNVGPDFKPYASNGNWVYTDEGWAWNSNYSWGWAPFHYGRWFYEDGYGWMWMPGNEWAPAWVTWRRSPDYYGWAPLGPSVSITVAAGGGYNPPSHYWCFVPHQYVTSPHINNYYVGEQQNVTIINNTTVIHNTTIVNNTYNNTTVVNNNRVTVNNYAGGPDPGEVSRVTGSQLRPVAVHESNTPGGNGSGGAFAVYRPRINAVQQGGNGGSGGGFRPAPTRVQPLTSVRPVNTTNYNSQRATEGNHGAIENNQGTMENNRGATENRGIIENNRGTINNTTTNNPTTNNATNNPTINNNNSSNTTTNNGANSNNNFHPNPTPSGGGQPAGQPGNQFAGHPGSQFAGHPGNTGAGNPAPANGGGNGHPGQPGASGNPPKPHPQQGPKPQNNHPKPQDTSRKPKPANPDNRQ